MCGSDAILQCWRLEPPSHRAAVCCVCHQPSSLAVTPLGAHCWLARRERTARRASIRSRWAGYQWVGTLTTFHAHVLRRLLGVRWSAPWATVSCAPRACPMATAPCSAPPRATPLPHAHPSVRGESLAGWRCWVAVRCSLLRDNRDSLGGTWPHAVTGIARSPAREVEECASARPAARRCRHHHLVLARGWTHAHALQLVHRDGVAEACVGARALP